ncbi:cytosine permease [Citricoccus sp. I39-566]|uniref:purine-cytosine permease family protein n=1 Tax=Citricoccus sp. I39-566 TaxID=3073268 RepID=UPI00286A482A|nr:cytosine permease [Citricoccus sp. I39-566]WMY78754.1 cytosine permease [Citricoccus sp. I39-566]
MASSSSTLVEHLTIQPVPESQRTGRARHLFPVWFGVQIMPLTLVTGVLGPTIYGLDLAWTVVAIIIGNVIGAVFMALHSVQGSKLGVPQMIQARAQFGMYGALLVLIVVILMYLGFLASILVLARDTLLLIVPGLSPLAALIACSVLALAIVLFGYEIIHRFNRYLLPLFALAVVLLGVFTFTHMGQASSSAPALGFSLTGFLAMAATAAIWQIAYAPYVSDYSRYLPSKTSSKSAFWFTYLGTVGGAIPVMVLGALLVTASGGKGDLQDLVAILPTPVMLFVVAMLFLGAMDAAVINLYGPALTTITMIQTFRTSWSPKARARNSVAIGTCFLATVIAAFFANDFLVSYGDFIHFLMTLLIPWSIVNLVDYYIVKRGDYDVAAFNDPKAGYGAFNVPALVTYVLGFIIQLPFMRGSFYTGPIAESLNGADLSWLVGSIASFFIYLTLIRFAQRRTPTPDLSRAAAPTPAPADVQSQP